MPSTPPPPDEAATTTPDAVSPAADDPALIEAVDGAEEEEGDEFLTQGWDATSSNASTSVTSSVYAHTFENRHRYHSMESYFTRKAALHALPSVMGKPFAALGLSAAKREVWAARVRASLRENNNPMPTHLSLTDHEENDAIALIVGLYAIISIVLSICICRLRRDAVPSSHDGYSSAPSRRSSLSSSDGEKKSPPKGPCVPTGRFTAGPRPVAGPTPPPPGNRFAAREGIGVEKCHRRPGRQMGSARASEERSDSEGTACSCREVSIRWRRSWDMRS
ncbi:hypothetical protein QBC33DRAFT_591716 [Phialemonium atrogriseum]|uniref:Uncharacterized protein n=1 Tax=Phialemonium atrogriseum TaxID=1093897 RepID=A0AAJ0CA08_9PEZI|nr:uncharacterized protein QBC33DRAFT_591716 [Phialemonium atrogriseum]KAK1771442.1 hypothetical protein QBC33DRAFT_591716 [Phialemonium atrogriseum]